MTEEIADRMIANFVEGEYSKAKIQEEMANELKPIIGSIRIVKLEKVERKFKKEILSKASKRGENGRKGKKRGTRTN